MLPPTLPQASLRDIHGNRACIHLCTDSKWLVRIWKEEVPRWEKEGWPDIAKYSPVNEMAEVDEDLTLNESNVDVKPPPPTTDSGVAFAKAVSRSEANTTSGSEESNRVVPKTSAAQRLAQAVAGGASDASSPTSTAASSPLRSSIPLHDSVRRTSTLGSRSVQFGLAQTTQTGPRRSSILTTAPSTYSLTSSLRSNSTPEERDQALLQSLGSDFVLLRSLVQFINNLGQTTRYTGGSRIYLIDGSKNPAREKSRERAKVEAEEREYKRKGQLSTLKKPSPFSAGSIKPRDSISRSNSNGKSSARSPSVKSRTRAPGPRSPLLGQEVATRSSIAEKAVAPRLRTYSSKSAGASGSPVVHRNSSLAPALPLFTSGLLIRNNSAISKRSERSNVTQRAVEEADVPLDATETEPVAIGRPMSVQRSRSGQTIESVRTARESIDQEEEMRQVRSPVTPLEKENVKFPKVTKSKVKSKPMKAPEEMKAPKKGLFSGFLSRIMA